MEICDAFFGVGAWFRRDRLLPWRTEELVALMDHFGIGSAVAHSNFTAGGGNAWHGNAILAEIVLRTPRLTPAFSYTPFPHRDSPRVDDLLTAMRQANSRMLFLFPHSAYPIRTVYGELLEACVAHRIPVGLNREHLTPAWIEELLRTWPDLRVLLVGCAYQEEIWVYPLLRRFEHLRLCVGHYFIPPDAPLRFLDEFPARRLVFGSGLPFFSPGGLIAHLMYAPIAQADREAIFSGNILQWMEEVRW